jgi:hypothetical protein
MTIELSTTEANIIRGVLVDYSRMQGTKEWVDVAGDRTITLGDLLNLFASRERRPVQNGRLELES